MKTRHLPSTFTRNQAGDTIVEVIIAVAVVATTLAGAFTLTNRSTQSVRDAQEHAEALQLLQGQVESLRAASQGTITMPSAIATPFCFSGNASYPATDTSHCLNQGNGSLYNLSVVCPIAQATCPNAAGTTTFQLTATWPGLHSTQDTALLYYRVDINP